MNLTKEIINKISKYGLYPNDMLLPNPDKIVRTKGGYEALRQLRQDPHVSSCIQSRRSGLLSMDWQIKDNGARPKIVQKVETMIQNINLDRFLRDILEAVLYGFQPIEIIWKEEKSRAAEPLLVPAELSAKPQEWFSFDNSGKLCYRSNKNKSEQLPENKILLAQYEPSFTNPYGTALLSKCYWSVTFKNGALRYWVTFTERHGLPWLIGQYQRGATQEDAEQLADSLLNMTENSVIVTPADIDITLKDTIKFDNISLYKELIKLCNDEISKALLSETLTTEMQGGSYAAAKVHSEVRKEVILSDKRMAEKVVNDLIRYYMNLNFPNQPVPKFVMRSGLTGMEEILKRDEMLLRHANVAFSKAYLIKKYGFDEADFA